MSDDPTGGALNVDLDGATVSFNGDEGDVSQDFKDVVQHYIGQGAAAILAAGEEIEEYGKKLVAVAEDAGTGAAMGGAIGTAFPIIGNVIGGAVGSFVGGVYGAFDQFGGDIQKILHNTLNPDDFSTGDYDRMRKRGILAGGLPNPGYPPDNEKGIIFPDGKTSGGDWPRWPGPGVQSMRGDTPYPVAIPQGMIPGPDGNPMPAFVLKGDPVVVAAADATRDVQLAGLRDYLAGLKKIDALIATARAQCSKKGTTTAQRNGYLDKITKAWTALSAATRTDGQAPDSKGFRSDLDKMLPHPPPLTVADVAASMKGLKIAKLSMLAPTKAQLVTLKTPMAIQTVHANATDAAHALVSAASAGDPQAQQAIQGVIASAANGDASAQHVLSVISYADAKQTIDRLIAKWVFGIGG